jgi:hypothetical protein
MLSPVRSILKMPLEIHELTPNIPNMVEMGAR